MTVSQYLREIRNFRDELYLLEVLLVAEKSLDLLKRLHAFGVIHGDIHGHNINVKQPDWGVDMGMEGTELVLIDLGQSRMICSDPETRESRPEMSFRLLSMWELQGNGIRGFRDDVFRLFELISDWISRGRLRNALSELSEASSAGAAVSEAVRIFLAEVKSETDYFGLGNANEYHAFDGYDSSMNIPRVSACLTSAMVYIRSIGSPEETVDFARLERELQCVRNNL